MSHDTREGWLKQATDILVKEFFQGRDLPKIIRVSCGFPVGSRTATGQCWDVSTSSDGSLNIFISPKIEDPIEVLGILLHELGHGHLGSEIGHQNEFAQLMREFGLAGKPSKTYVEIGTELEETFKRITKTLGAYPHSAVTPRYRSVKTNKWIRLKSTEEPSYTITISPRTMATWGAPVDPWGQPMVPVEKEG